MDNAAAKTIFDTLFSDVNGRSLSLAGRQQHDYKSKSFVYGEVVPDSFLEIITETHPQKGQIFYDLGSGTGKAVILAHLLFDFSEAIGIEFVDSLYDASLKVKQRYESEIKPSLEQYVGDKQINFILGDFLNQDLSNADVIFMNSTCFQDDLMDALDNKLHTNLKPGAQVISLSKSLKSPSFEMWKRRMAEFSWGEATVFFHRKIS